MIGLIITLVIVAILSGVVVWAAKKLIRAGKEIKKTFEE